MKWKVGLMPCEMFMEYGGRECGFNKSSLALEKDPGFDLYWLAQALQKTQDFPDELERWPVELVHPIDPKQLKRRFQEIALEIMARLQRS